MRYAALLLIALVWSSASVTARPMDGAGDPALACPFAAHNAYPEDGKGAERQREALKAGLRHIETDITWDARRRAVVVTHDGEPDGDEPELAAFLQPIWDRWESESGEGYTLIFDCKSGESAIATALDELLKPHAAALSWMTASAGAPFHPGPITVCISGNPAVKRAYEKLARRQGRFLAFADRVAGDGTWRENPAEYVPGATPAYERFLTVSLENLMKSGQGTGPRRWFDVGTDKVRNWLHVGWFAGDEDTISADRLETLARAAQRQGWVLRVFTANRSGGNVRSTKLWELCVAAGIPMIATDDYAAAGRWWRSLE